MFKKSNFFVVLPKTPGENFRMMFKKSNLGKENPAPCGNRDEDGKKKVIYITCQMVRDYPGY